MVAGLRMCERVTVFALATTDMATGHTHSSRSVQSALRTGGVIDLEDLTVCIFKMGTITGLYTCHKSDSLSSAAHPHRRQCILHQHRYCQRADATGYRGQVTGHLSGFTWVDITYECISVLLEGCATLLITSKETLEIFACCDSVHSHVHHRGARLDVACVHHSHFSHRDDQNVRLTRDQRKIPGSRMTDCHRRVLVQ